MENAFCAQMMASQNSSERETEAGRLQEVPGDRGRRPGLQSGLDTNLLGNPIQITSGPQFSHL